MGYTLIKIDAVREIIVNILSSIPDNMQSLVLDGIIQSEQSSIFKRLLIGTKLQEAWEQAEVRTKSTIREGRGDPK